MILFILACASESAPTFSRDAPASEAPAPPPNAAPAEGGAAFDDAEEKSSGSRVGGLKKEAKPDRPKSSVREEDGKADKDAESDGRADEGPAARSWFPETFLWLPSIATDAQGLARIPVTVPDTLTTWRVLALGHTAGGAQGGDEASFQSSLPAYVELRVPSFLVAGDTLRLPMLVVNQQTQALTASLGLTVRGGTGGAAGSISVAPGSSGVREASVVAGGPGALELAARLGDLDAVTRSVPIRPSGLPVSEARGGTLAASREVTVSAVAGGHDGTVDVTVFPGFHGYVENELRGAAFGGGGGLADEVYRYLLATQARALGASAEQAAMLRTIELRAWQKLVRAGRTPDPWTAALLRVGLGTPSKDTPAGALAERLDDVIQQGQQPDGLWGLPPGSTIDQALVHTAWCAWNAGEGKDGTTLRAGSAFGRHAPRLVNPNLAAWALVSGSVEEPLRAKLVETVKTAIVRDEAGGAMLPGGGVRPDGQPMSTLDATAVAALALKDDPALASELVTWLLAHRADSDGFGDILMLRAFSTVLGGEIPGSVAVRLLVDGAEVGRATLDPTQPHAPISLRAPVDAQAHTLTLVSEPAVAGLAWTMDRKVWVDTAPARPQGVDLAMAVPALTRNQPGTLSMSVSAPSGQSVDIELGLPAGVSVDGAALSALVSAGQARRVWQEDGRVRILGAFAKDGVWTGALPVTGTVAGSLRAAPTQVIVGGRKQEALVVQGARWEVR